MADRIIEASEDGRFLWLGSDKHPGEIEHRDGRMHVAVGLGFGRLRVARFAPGIDPVKAVARTLRRGLEYDAFRQNEPASIPTLDA